MKGDARAKAAAEGARTVPPREHGGNCDIKDLSRGSKIFFPVYVDGAGLTIGDLHFSQGDGEITFAARSRWPAGCISWSESSRVAWPNTASRTRVQALTGDAELQGLPDLRRHLGRRSG